MKKYFAILTSTKLGISLMKAGLLVLILPYISLSQIKIEERVEIEAQTYQLNSPTNPTEPTFTYILSWPTSQYWRGTIKIVSCYGDTTTTGWTSGGYATITMPGRGHHIFNMITERWYYDNQKGWGWYEDLHPEAVRKVLINNQEWNQFNLLGAMIGTIDIPLLRMNDDICDSGYAKLEIVPTNWSDCEEIGWLPIDELKLRITKGTEFASFFNKRTNTNLGSQVQINPFVELENLRLFFGFEWEEDGFDEVVIKFNENVPADSIPVNIEVEAEINGVVFSGENIFFHTDRPLIKAEINPNKITGGEETSINIELLNRCAVDPFTTLNIEIIEGQEFGNLINPYTNEKTKIITNLFQRWGYAWAPYLADNAPIDEIKEVTIRVSTSDPSFPPRDIKLYILPSPIYAYTVPEVLGADEEADVIIKKRNPDGTLEDFPPNQTFELAVLDGCVNGNFMVNGVIDVYFADAQQPIKFVTADSLDSEVDSVLIRVGTEIEGYMRPIGNEKGEKQLTEKQKGLDTLRAGFEKMIAEKKAEAEAETKEGGEPMFPVVPACAPNNPNWQLTYYNFLASVQDECDEEIVVCNDYQPPKFEDVGTISVLGEHDPWHWIDDQGDPQSTNTGTACDYQIDPDEFGKTYIMDKIGDFASGNPVYNLLDDTKVIVCQNKNNPNDPIWRYSVKDIRIPIFTAHCSARPIANGFIDLEDGNNAILLNDNIKNCTDYVHVMETLDWWWNGPYWQEGQSPPFKFYFSTGTIAHENVHVKQLRDGGTKAFPIASISKEMNGTKGLPVLVKYIYSAIIAKCPSDALIAIQGFGTMEERVINQLKVALNDANELKYRGGVDGQLRYKSELEADELARSTYNEIKKNIENWAKQQSWWCIPWPIVGDDYYRGCDKSECTP